MFDSKFSKSAALFLIGLLLFISGLGYLSVQNPVGEESVYVTNPDTYSDTEYTGDVYVYNLVSGEDDLILRFYDKDYKEVEYTFDVYYVNHTGVSSEGFSGGGSSNIEDYYSVNDRWSKSSNKSTLSYNLSSNHAFALVDFKVEEKVIADGRHKYNIISIICTLLMSIGILIIAAVITDLQ